MAQRRQPNVRTSNTKDIEELVAEDAVEERAATAEAVDRSATEQAEQLESPADELERQEGLIESPALSDEGGLNLDFGGTVGVPVSGSDVLGPPVDFDPGSSNPVADAGVWGDETRTVGEQISHGWEFTDDNGTVWTVLDGGDDHYYLAAGGELIHEGTASDIDGALQALGLDDDAEDAASFSGRFMSEASHAWSLFKKEFGLDSGETETDTGTDSETDDADTDDTDETNRNDSDSDDSDSDDTDSDDTDDTDTTDSADDTTDDTTDDSATEPEDAAEEEQQDETSVDPETGFVLDPEAHVEVTDWFVDRYPELGDDPGGHDVDPSPIVDDTVRGELPKWEGALPNDGDVPVDPAEVDKLIEENWDTLNPVSRQENLIDWGDGGRPGGKPLEPSSPPPSPIVESESSDSAVATAFDASVEGAFSGLGEDPADLWEPDTGDETDLGTDDAAVGSDDDGFGD